MCTQWCKREEKFSSELCRAKRMPLLVVGVIRKPNKCQIRTKHTGCFYWSSFFLSFNYALVVTLARKGESLNTVASSIFWCLYALGWPIVQWLNLLTNFAQFNLSALWFWSNYNYHSNTESSLQCSSFSVFSVRSCSVHGWTETCIMSLPTSGFRECSSDCSTGVLIRILNVGSKLDSSPRAV